MWLSGILWLLSHLSAASASAVPSAASVRFTNTQRFLFDVDGNQIDAYGSKINQFQGIYYLYGNSFSTTGGPFGIKSYSSADLVNWKYEGLLYDPNSLGNPCLGSGGCGRPHIIYSAISNKYILWANAGSSGYVIATSSSPSGPFEFSSQHAAIDPQFDGLQPADFAVETFGDKGYLVFSALNFRDPRAGSIWPPVFQTLQISELTPDFMNTTLTSYPVRSADFDLLDQEAESPDIFVRNGTYYIAASNTCAYCNGSVALMYRASSIQGPWTRQLLSEDSCAGQVEGVFSLRNPVSGDVSYIWHSTSVPGGPRVGFSGHIFQPLQFSQDGAVADLNCDESASFSVRFAKGNGSVPSGEATQAVDGSPLQAAYNAVCDSDQFSLFQTWTASRGGTIKSVSLNVARSVQTAPLVVTVFKYSNDAELLAPSYKWTTLGSVSANASSLSYVFDTLTVPVTTNATVHEGEKLGLAFSGSDYAPYCHLEYSRPRDPSSILYQLGVGHNHYQGFDGRASPVYERVGKGLKFFVTYQ